MERADAVARSGGALRGVLRSRTARFAAVVLALLVSSAVFAPFVSGASPYTMRAMDVRACRGASAALAPIATSWRELLSACAAARNEARELRTEAAAHAVRTSREALARELRAFELRTTTLKRYLERDSDAVRELAALEAALRGWTQRVSDSGADDLEPSRAVVAGAEAWRAKWGPGIADGTAKLVERRSFPLLAERSWSEWWLAFAWTGAVVLALARAKPLRHLHALAACAVLAWLAHAGFSSSPGLATGSLKEALSSGDVLASSTLFPPLPFGFDETNLSEIHRPPTWLGSSEIDESGRYVRGPRALRADPATGFEPAATPVEVRFAEPARNSALRHPMGTDAIGRDVLVRLLWGGRASLGVGFASMALVTLLGIALGGLAGYFRGWIDSGVSACIELLQSFPSFLLVLAAIGIGLDGELGRRVSPLVWVVAVIGLVGWTGVARLVRAESLRVRTLDYVTAARALGFSPPRVLLRHVLPNCLAPAIVAAAFALAYAILTESAVSFFGLGVRAPTPSWGSIMQSERAVSHAWTFVFPGLAIAASCASCAWIGDALRDALDPREGS